tara:strand:- start:2589 stop:3518 length:930 start_codon:yes stop_codon:yes gene_type:complete
MVDNQGTDTSQSANEMFDESVFTDAPQTEAPESSVDNTLTPTDAFTAQTGEEAPEAAPSEVQEQPKPLEAKNDDTRFQYWQSQAAQKDNQIRQMQQQMQQAQQQMQQPQAEPEPAVQEFPPPPERPAKPRNFNRQEAFEDSSSESARYLDEVDEWRDKMDEYNSLRNQYDNALVREKMEKMEEERNRAIKVREAQIQQANQMKEVDQLMQGNYGMTPQESQDFIKQMSDPSSISIDNLVKLYRLQNGQGNAAPAQGQPAEPSPTFQQAQRAQQVPQPMGVQPTAGKNTVSSEDQIMDNMISDFKSKNPW